MVLRGRMDAKGVRVKSRPFAEDYKKTGRRTRALKKVPNQKASDN
jgi:hypothetical protein